MAAIMVVKLKMKEEYQGLGAKRSAAGRRKKKPYRRVSAMISGFAIQGGRVCGTVNPIIGAGFSPGGCRGRRLDSA